MGTVARMTRVRAAAKNALYYQIFHNDLKFTTDRQQNPTSHEPRSRAFYYSINSLLHTWNSYYTEPPMKVPITPHHLKYRYYATPPIIIALGSFSLYTEPFAFGLVIEIIFHYCTTPF